MMYWIDGDFIRFEIDDKRGFMPKDYTGEDMSNYLKWLDEGNEAELWTPIINEGDPS